MIVLFPPGYFKDSQEESGSVEEEEEQDNGEDNLGQVEVVAVDEAVTIGAHPYRGF